MAVSIQEIKAQLAQLQAESDRVSRMPPTVAERFAVIEAEYRQAERLYRERGLKIDTGHPAETVHLQRLAVIGACMVVGADKLLRAERERIAQAGEGLSGADKARRLDQLRRQVLQVAARRELALREVEGEGEYRPRDAHPELAIFRQADVERLATVA
jgi:hypothetical protein